MNNKGSLWNNEMVQNAKKHMSAEDIKKYQEIGESMYKNIDYTTSNIHNAPSLLDDAVAYITESIKSGLHISYTTKEERDILETYYGKEWYLKFNYTKEDLEEIVTLKKE
jgi:hypothetical protein